METAPANVGNKYNVSLNMRIRDKANWKNNINVYCIVYNFNNEFSNPYLNFNHYFII